MPVRAKKAPPDDLPAHVAIIMDGNGRWARRHGWRRMRGHEQGAKAVREIITAGAEMHLREMTLYAFSTENWRRPEREVKFLMQLLERQLVAERDTLMENNIRFRGIGLTDALPESVRNELDETTGRTADNTGMVLRLALNYGGRRELLDAMRAISAEVRDGALQPNEIDEEVVRRHMYDPEMTDPDLLIRTGGEMRVSNFLLWWLSYTELYVTEVYWPDFRRPQLEEALKAYSKRQRRFGTVPDGPEPAGAEPPAVHAQSTVCEDPADQ